MGAGILAPGYIRIPGVPWVRSSPDTIIHIYIYTVIISAVLLKARVRLFAQRLLHQQNSFFHMIFFGPSVEDSWWHDVRVCAWAFETLCPSFFFVTGRHCQEHVQASARVATACLYVMVERSGSPPPHFLSSAVNPSSRQRHPMALKLVSGVCLYVRSIIFRPWPV